MERLFNILVGDPIVAFIALLGFALLVAIVVKGIQGAAERARTKECPACKSRVPRGATKCKHCASAL